MRIAVIGGGVGACSLAHGLRECIAAKTASLHLFEMGRGTGGRAATRSTREKPGLRVDHGVAAFAAHTPSFTALCESLVSVGALRRCGTADAFGRLAADGTFAPETPADAPTRYCAPEGKGMSTLCDALLRADDGSQIADATLGTMVAQVEASTASDAPPRWKLTSRRGDDLGTYDWLVVTSTGIAHPRWRATFGGEPPLVEAAAALHDPRLDAALAALAPLTAKPVTTALLAYEADAAAAWAALPFVKARVDDDPVLARVVVQRVGRSLVSVALHSTHAFARGAAHVYGATSAAARVAGAASDAREEARVARALLDAAERRLGGLLGGAAALRSPAWGPHLHRWGAAFPDAPLLAEAQAVVPSARVAFCGDFVQLAGAVERGRAASVEGAALSGLRLAEALKHEIERCGGVMR